MRLALLVLGIVLVALVPAVAADPVYCDPTLCVFHTKGKACADDGFSSYDVYGPFFLVYAKASQDCTKPGPGYRQFLVVSVGVAAVAWTDDNGTSMIQGNAILLGSYFWGPANGHACQLALAGTYNECSVSPPAQPDFWDSLP